MEGRLIAAIIMKSLTNKTNVNTCSSEGPTRFDSDAPTLRDSRPPFRSELTTIFDTSMSTVSSTHCSQLQQPTLKGVATLSTDDAVLIVLAVHLGLLRALTHHFGERQAIDSGDVFVFRVTKGKDAEGITRLRDGRYWSPRRQDVCSTQHVLQLNSSLMLSH